MFVDKQDREEMINLRLATRHPHAYEAKMRAMREYDPFKDLASFIKNLFAKKAK